MLNNRRLILGAMASEAPQPEEGLVYHFPLTEDGVDIITGITPSENVGVTFDSNGANFPDKSIARILAWNNQISLVNVRRVTVEFYPFTNTNNSFAFRSRGAVPGNYLCVSIPIWSYGFVEINIGAGTGSNTLYDSVGVTTLPYAPNAWNHADFYFGDTGNQIVELTANGETQQFTSKTLVAKGLLSQASIGNDTTANVERGFLGYIRNLKFYNQ